MKKNEFVSFRMTPDLAEKLDWVKDQFGTPYSEQIRRGLQLWFELREHDLAEAAAKMKPRAKKVSRG